MNINKQKREHNKENKYIIERMNLLQNLYDILNINEHNKCFYSYIINNNEDVCLKICNMKDDIQKYFNILKNNNNVLNINMSIIKSMFKDMKVKYTSTSFKMKNNNGKYITTTKYNIINLT